MFCINEKENSKKKIIFLASLEFSHNKTIADSYLKIFLMHEWNEKEGKKDLTKALSEMKTREIFFYVNKTCKSHKMFWKALICLKEEAKKNVKGKI